MARILVVDDDKSNAEVLQLVLQDQQHEVIAINNSELIDATVQRFMPQLIVMDILLDAGDGRTFCDGLKEKTNTRHIPILLITAMLESRAKAVTCLADALMFKPFDYQKLVDKVSSLIKN